MGSSMARLAHLAPLIAGKTSGPPARSPSVSRTAIFSTIKAPGTRGLTQEISPLRIRSVRCYRRVRRARTRSVRSGHERLSLGESNLGDIGAIAPQQPFQTKPFPVIQFSSSLWNKFPSEVVEFCNQNDTGSLLGTALGLAVKHFD